MNWRGGRGRDERGGSCGRKKRRREAGARKWGHGAEEVSGTSMSGAKRGRATRVERKNGRPSEARMRGGAVSGAKEGRRMQIALRSLWRRKGASRNGGRKGIVIGERWGLREEPGATARTTGLAVRGCGVNISGWKTLWDQDSVRPARRSSQKREGAPARDGTAEKASGAQMPRCARVAAAVEFFRFFEGFPRFGAKRGEGNARTSSTTSQSPG